MVAAMIMIWVVFQIHIIKKKKREKNLKIELLENLWMLPLQLKLNSKSFSITIESAMET